MAELETPQHLSSKHIARTVVNDEDLGGGQSLMENACQGFIDRASQVVARDDDSDARPAHG
jgi:hypothetical protein